MVHFVKLATFQLLMSKWHRWLILLLKTCAPNMNFLHISVHDLGVGTGQTDGRTDGMGRAK